MEDYATVNDVRMLWRDLTAEEQERTEALIPVVCASLRQEARNRSRDLDSMLEDGQVNADVLKSVVVDVVARTLMTSTNSEPMTQRSESALGYSVSGTFLIPGGGLFIKRSELARLGIARQRVSAINVGWDNGPFAWYGS